MTRAPTLTLIDEENDENECPGRDDIEELPKRMRCETRSGHRATRQPTAADIVVCSATTCSRRLLIHSGTWCIQFLSRV